MDPKQYPPMIQRLLTSIEQQGAQFVRMNYDPEGGSLNQGRLFIAARKDGRVFTMSGSLTRTGNDLEWAMVITDNYTEEQWAQMPKGESE